MQVCSDMPDFLTSAGLRGTRDRASAAARERSISLLAECQHGVATTAQLGALGFNGQAVALRVAAGRLHRVHRGVYAVGHPILSVDGHRLAAVLACGDGALASHTTAAAIWGIRPDNGRLMHVMTAGSARSRAGIRVHHAREIAPADRTLRDRIAVTSLARTLVDLGDVVKPDHVRAAFVRAEQLRLLDMAAIDDALTRATHRRGPSALREILRGYDPRWQETRSPLEQRLLDVHAGRGLPEPEINEWVDATYMVDFLWRDQRLVVETDGNQVHGTSGAKRRDARRDRALMSRGFRIIHVSRIELESNPDAVAAIIAQRLTASSPQPAA